MTFSEDDEKEERDALQFLTEVGDHVANFFNAAEKDDGLNAGINNAWTTNKVLETFLVKGTEDSSKWALAFATVFADKQQEKRAKNEFLNHAQNVLESDTDITNNDPFALSNLQKSIVARCQRYFTVKAPAEDTLEGKLQYVTKLMNAAIMVSTLTNTSLVGLLLPVTSAWVNSQRANMSKNGYKITKLSCQGDSSRIATTMKYALKQYNLFQENQKKEALQAIEYQAEDASEQVKVALEHAKYQLSLPQSADFCCTKGPRAMVMILVNHFVHRWVLDPTKSRHEIYKLVYNELIDDGPQNSTDLKDKIDLLRNDVNIADLKDTLEKLAEDNTKDIQHPFETSTTITVIKEDERKNFNGTLKQFIKLTESMYDLKYTAKKDGPDPLIVLQQFLESEFAPQDLKTKLAGLLKMSPHPTTEWLNWESKNLSRPVVNKQQALSYKDRQQINQKRKFRSQEDKRQRKIAKESKERRKAIDSKTAKKINKQKALSLLKEAGFKEKDDVLDLTDFLSNKAKEDWPPVPINPGCELLADISFDPSEINLKTYYLCDDEGLLLTFEKPGTEFKSKMEDLVLQLLSSTDLSSIKAAHSSEEYKAYIKDMAPQEKIERIGQVWAALFSYLHDDFPVDKITTDLWYDYIEESKSTFLSAYHQQTIKSACLCFSYFTLGTSFHDDVDEEDVHDQQDQLRTELIEAVTAELPRGHQDKSISIAAKLIRIQLWNTGICETWNEAKGKKIRESEDDEDCPLKQLNAACTDLRAHEELMKKTKGKTSAAESETS